MENLPAWMDLAKTDNLRIWQEDLEYLWRFNFVPEIKVYHDTLTYLLDSQPQLKSAQPALYQQYADLLLRGKWFVLSLLPLSVVQELFGKYIIMALRLSDYDIWERLVALLIFTPTLETRDKIKQQLREVLLNNAEPLWIPSGDESKVVTVGAFLKKAFERTGAKSMNSVEINEFLIAECKGFDNDAKELARKLLHLFERLKLSSLSLEGFEQPIPVNDGERQGVIRQGVFEPYQLSESERTRFDAIFSLLGRQTEANAQLPSLQTASSAPSVPAPRAIPPIIEVLRPTIMPPFKPAPQVIKSSGPAFLFDEADEREADRYRERMANGEWRMAKNLESRLRGLAEEVAKEHNFSFKDEVSHKRFVQLFVSFLKDVRDVIEAREMLLRNTDSGGLGLTSEKAEKVIEILQQTKKEFESRIKNQELGIEEKNGILRPASGGTQNDVIHKPKTELDKMIEADRYRISNDEFLISKKNLEIEKPEIAPPKSSLGPAMTRGPEPKITPPTPSDAAKAQVLRQQILEQIVSKIEADKTAPLPPPEPLARPKLVDVKAPPRVLGPLEELRTLSVVDFRRLAENPVEALNKINKKIDIVGEASVGKRVEAVRAWQASPVYQLYLKIGRASIETGQSVADIIAEQAQKNETTLSEDEFNAVADFNEKIRF